jgi:hypothetical protein
VYERFEVKRRRQDFAVFADVARGVFGVAALLHGDAQADGGPAHGLKLNAGGSIKTTGFGGLEDGVHRELGRLNGHPATAGIRVFRPEDLEVVGVIDQTKFG